VSARRAAPSLERAAEVALGGPPPATPVGASLPSARPAFGVIAHRRALQRLLSVPGLVVDEPEVELPGLELLDDELVSEPEGVLVLLPDDVPG
jgi:hypothetical protein